MTSSAVLFRVNASGKFTQISRLDRSTCLGLNYPKAGFAAAPPIDRMGLQALMPIWSFTVWSWQRGQIGFEKFPFCRWRHDQLRRVEQPQVFLFLQLRLAIDKSFR